MSPGVRALPLRVRGEGSLQHQRGDRAEALGEQLLPELGRAQLRGHHGHQSSGRRGHSSASDRL